MDRMKCDYCGKTGDGVELVLGGHSDGESWTMHEGTGKVSCHNRQCWQAASDESQAVINSLIPASFDGYDRWAKLHLIQRPPTA